MTESINLEFKANNRKRSKPLDIEASFLFPYFSKGMSKYNEDLLNMKQNLTSVAEIGCLLSKTCQNWGRKAQKI